MRATSQSRYRFILAVVLLCALALRIGTGIFLGFNSPPDRNAMGSDTVEYEHMAWSMSQGKGCIAAPGGKPTAFRAPGYPMMLAVLYMIFGRVYFVNRLALSIIGTATCWLVYLLALRLKLGHVRALIAALITAVLPLQFYYCGHFMSEPPATILNVATCLLLVIALNKGQERARLLLLFTAGTVCGFSTLVRPISLLVPGTLGLLLLMSHSISFRKVILWTGVFCIGTVLPIAPWTIRNKIVLDRFCPLTSMTGAAFRASNNKVVAKFSNEWGYWSMNFDLEVKDREIRPLKNEIDRDRKEMKLAWEWIRANPHRVPLLLLGKIYRLVTPFPISSNKMFVCVVGIGQFFLLPAFVVGLVLVLSQNLSTRRLFLPVMAQLLTLIVAVLIFYGNERFRAAYEPFAAIFAAIVLGKFMKIALSQIGWRNSSNISSLI